MQFKGHSRDSDGGSQLQKTFQTFEFHHCITPKRKDTSIDRPAPHIFLFSYSIPEDQVLRASKTEKNSGGKKKESEKVPSAKKERILRAC